MTDVSPVQVVDIDLTSFRIPPPPFWRNRNFVVVYTFGPFLLALLVALAGGERAIPLAVAIFVLALLGEVGFGIWGMAKLVRDRSSNSVAGTAIPYAREEDLDRTPPGFNRPLRHILQSMRQLEAGAPPPEIVKRPIPPEARRHVLAYQASAAGVGVLFVIGLVIGIRGMLPTFAAMAAAFALLTRARRVIAQNAAEVISHDHRAPILFLRSFMDDQIKVKQWQHLFGFQNPMPIRFEEALGGMIGRYGPFLAIGEPKEGLPQLGAARAYPGDNEWQAMVTRWISEARLITMLCGPTRWVHWEVQNVIAAARINRLLLFLPPGRGGPLTQQKRRRIERWENILKSMAATPYGPAMQTLQIDDVLLLQFGAEGRLNVFRSAGDKSQDYALATTLAASLAADAPSDGPPAASLSVVSAGTIAAPVDEHPADGAAANADTPALGMAPPALPLQLAGVGAATRLVLGTMMLLAGGGLRTMLGQASAFLFAAAIAGAVALWGGRERRLWPFVAAALIGVTLLNLVLIPLLIRYFEGHLSWSFRPIGIAIGFTTRVLQVAALAIAIRCFRAPLVWATGLAVAVLVTLLTLVPVDSAVVQMLMSMLFTALTSAWIGFGLSRRAWV